MNKTLGMEYYYTGYDAFRITVEEAELDSIYTDASGRYYKRFRFSNFFFISLLQLPKFILCYHYSALFDESLYDTQEDYVYFSYYVEGDQLVSDGRMEHGQKSEKVENGLSVIPAL